jgi:hypothetical protein
VSSTASSPACSTFASNAQNPVLALAGGFVDRGASGVDVEPAIGPAVGDVSGAVPVAPDDPVVDVEGVAGALVASAPIGTGAPIAVVPGATVVDVVVEVDDVDVGVDGAALFESLPHAPRPSATVNTIVVLDVIRRRVGTQAPSGSAGPP